MDWWDECPVTDDVKIACTPAQHWSARTPGMDRNKSLWCSWNILASKAKFFFAGDTGYCNVFKVL